MKKVAKSPLVMDIVNIPGVQKSLERLADLLGKIQKALGEYLERERASFPRLSDHLCLSNLYCIVTKTSLVLNPSHPSFCLEAGVGRTGNEAN